MPQPFDFTAEQKKLVHKLERFQPYFSGEILTDNASRIIYATDASLYRKIPLAVAYPKSSQDIQNLILFCRNNQTSLIPRTAGTSLGGQCVGEGIIVDVSRYMTSILEINAEEGYAIVQPGVVRDELNLALNPYKLHFGPNTSTSNRAMIGGMVGNNSSGSFSIKYGTTRENVLAVKGFLSDGSEVVFEDLTIDEFRRKSHGTSLESAIYRQISFELNHPISQAEIDKEFPKSSVQRRNTGYALDFLLNTEPFYRGYDKFNFSKMLCGSEGTLMFFSEIKLKLHPAPTNDNALICVHFDSLEKSLLGAVEAMKLNPNQCELMDKTILDCTKGNIVQNQNRFFIQGEPEAILMIEVEAKPESNLSTQIQTMKDCLSTYGYHFPVLIGEEMKKAMQLRAAGLGVLQNIRGDERPIEFVEDTAVDIEDLPDYIKEFDLMIKSLGTSSVFYAHAGAGELHTRPRVNLKTVKGRAKFRQIAESSANLVKKYKGSLSGEHGDGLVRAEFIPLVLGQRNYELMRRIKHTWDPYNIFNPNKIVDAPPMDSSLKDNYTLPEHSIETMMRFQKEGSFIHAAEKCSGSGDCRKSSLIGGTLCPSFQATKNEKHSTRARANILREFLTHQSSHLPFAQEEIYDVLKLCLSCKACISECPSSVDMASMKSEFLYQYHQSHSYSRLEKNLGNFYHSSRRVSGIAPLVNLINHTPLINTLIKRVIGVDNRRSLPKYSRQTVESWAKKRKPKRSSFTEKVYLYVDEFTNFLDASIGIKTILLLEELGVEPILLPFLDSSRSLISKGFLKEAKQNIQLLLESFQFAADDNVPIVGIEPSAILGLRDDYFRLALPENEPILSKLSAKTLLIEEYLDQLFSRKTELKTLFSTEKNEILFHGHCHQKSLSSSKHALNILNFPEGNHAVEIPSGCCGMAGSFGYEHYDLSMQIGNLVLFPTITRHSGSKICASGTSCRHQIKDGTQRDSIHPIELLFDALKK